MAAIDTIAPAGPAPSIIELLNAQFGATRDAEADAEGRGDDRAMKEADDHQEAIRAVMMLQLPETRREAFLLLLHAAELQDVFVDVEGTPRALAWAGQIRDAIEAVMHWMFQPGDERLVCASLAQAGRAASERVQERSGTLVPA